MSFPIPTELLHEIALRLVSSEPLGPSSILLPLLRTNKALNKALTHPHLLARIFKFKFDHGAIRRRAYTPHSPDLAGQLSSYCHALRVIRQGDVYHEDAEDALLTAYLMMLENDGKNRAQLEWAGVEEFVERWVMLRLYEDAGENDGWPGGESVGGACAVWLMWLFTTREKLEAEPIAKREQIVSLLLPFVLVPYRYPSAHAPPHHYTLPLPRSSLPSLPTHPSLTSAHGPYPLYPHNTTHLIHHFGSTPNISIPLITLPAKLLYFARREVIPFQIPPHLPENREEALRMGREGPTKEDMREVNGYMGARMGDRVTWDWERGEGVVECAPLAIPSSPSTSPSPRQEQHPSETYDSLWWRLRLCSSPFLSLPRILPGHTFTPGSLTGLWQGRLLIPSEDAVMRLIRTKVFPGAAFGEGQMMVTTQPVFMRLGEYKAVGEGVASAAVPLSSGHEGEQEDTFVTDTSLQNAWFPGRIGGVSFTPTSHPTPFSSHLRDLVTVRTDYDPPSSPGSLYEKFDRGKQSAHDEETCARCKEKREVLERVKREEREEEERVRRVFESVGLGMSTSSRSCSSQEEDSDDEDDEEDEEDEDEVQVVEVQLEMEGDDYPHGQPAVMSPSGEFIPATRRVHDRMKVPSCEDGSGEGVVICGSTDYRHAQAWNGYTFYGRVRPWDGLVGILRMARYPAVNHVLFYGYIINERNFVGNWRVAGVDPLLPAWESAFVMSRREG